VFTNVQKLFHLENLSKMYQKISVKPV